MSASPPGLTADAAVIGTGAAPRAATAVDTREAMAERNLLKFGVLLAQLVLLLGVFQFFDIEEAAFEILSLLIAAGFAIHYWLPFAWKEPFYIAWSIFGAFMMLQPMTAALLIAAGFALFAIVSLPVAMKVRLGILAGVVAALCYARAVQVPGIPFDFWPIFGSIFMFRFIVYVYDAAYAKTRPVLRDFLTYFYILPNYYFLLFPVIDFQTHRQA